MLQLYTEGPRLVQFLRPGKFHTRVHSILDIGVICFQFWTGPDLKIAPFERVLKNLLDTGPWD